LSKNNGANIIKKTMRKLIDRYKQPTPKKWRMIGDFAIIVVPVLEIQLNQMPTVNPWVKWSITTSLILFKFWTNTRVEKK